MSSPEKLAQEIAAALHQQFWVNQHASSTPATVEEIAATVLPLLVPSEKPREPGCEHDSQIQQALRDLKENPWDTIDLHYDAGEWSITLHEDCGPTVEIEPGESLLDRLRAAQTTTRQLPPCLCDEEGASCLRHPVPAPLTRAEEAQPQTDDAGLRSVVLQTYALAGLGLNGFPEPARACLRKIFDVTEAALVPTTVSPPEPPPEAQSEEPKP